MHEVSDAGEAIAEAAGGVEVGEVLGGKSAVSREGKGEGVTKGEHDGGGGGGGEIVGAGLLGDGGVENVRCGVGEGGGGAAGEGDDPDFEAGERGKEGEEFGGFARSGERDEGVAMVEHAEVTVEGLGGVEEVSGGAGGAESGGDLLGDDAAFADTGEDERPAGLEGSGEQGN